MPTAAPANLLAPVPATASAALAGVGSAPSTTDNSGLFGQLLTVGSAPTGTPIVVQPAAQGANTFAADGTPLVQQDLQTLIGQILGQVAPTMGEGTLQVQGSVQQLTIMVQQITVTTTQLQAAGVNVQALGTDVAQLAQALQVLGMPADQAAVVANKIMTALAMVRQQAQLAAEDANALALMLASSAQGNLGAGSQNWQVEITTTSITSSTLTASFQLADGWAKDAKDGGTDALTADLAQLLAGFGFVPSPLPTASSAATPILTTEQPLATTTPTLPTTVVVGQQGFVAQGADGAGNPVIVRHPDAKEAATLAVTINGTANAAPLANAVAQTVSTATAKGVSSVAAADVIAAPTGEVMYEWKPSESGVETLHATPAVHKALEDILNPASNPTAATHQWTLSGPAAPTPTPTNLAGYSDQLASALRSQVPQQVNVQFSKLAADGGGTIRVQLNPESLGEITIDLTVHNGAVHGSISATDTAVVEVLAREMGQLKQSLADAGLKLADQGINLMFSNSGNQQFSQGQPQQQAQNTPARMSNTSTELPSTQTTVTTWVNPDRLVDVSI